MRAEIADARLHVELPVGTNRHQTVEPDRPCPVRTDGNADAADFRSAPRSSAGLAIVPLEQVGAPVERLGDERARDVTARARTGRSVRRLSPRRVDSVDLNLVDSKLVRCLRDDR